MIHSGTRIGVIGAGAWGTALAILATRAGSSTALWTRNTTVLNSVQEKRINEPYLPGVFIDPNIRVTSDLSVVCSSDIVVLAIPSQSFRSLCIGISDLIPTHIPLVIATKGIERGSLALMSEVAHITLPDNPIAILSGPNFADEAAKGLPTATTIACADEVIGDQLVYALGGKLFRPYLTNDLVGTQIGGAVKNVIAIACGIATGRKLGENAVAALITRGFAEISRMCKAKGGRPETLMGLSGIGDLLLTCRSTKSRNMSVGIALGQGRTPEDILTVGLGRGTAEGVATADSVVKLARKLNIEMPICQAVQSILYDNADISKVIEALLERPFAPELA